MTRPISIHPRARPLLWLAALWLLSAAAVAARPMAEPRRLTAAERQAVALAAGYFERGAAAWWDALAPDSPLYRLGRQAAILEIKVRTGPTLGASWRLATPAARHGAGVAIFTAEFPSGLDAAIVLELDEASGGPAGRWKIRQVRSLADPASGPTLRLAPLLALRQALAGTHRQDPETLVAALPAGSDAAEVGRLWEAAYRLGKLEVDRAAALLGADRRASQLAELTAGRLALVEDDLPAAIAAYDAAAKRGWDYDALTLEKAEGLAGRGGFQGLIDGYAALAEMGSRRAEVYYGLARLAALAGDRSGGRFLGTAWSLHPIERRGLFDDPLLAHLAAQPNLFELLALGSPTEPRFGPTAAERRPLGFSSAVRAVFAGNHLSLSVGGGEIVVPGGGVLAPEGLMPADAGAETRRSESEALAWLETLNRAAGDPGALALPLLHRRLEAAALALAQRRRWPELVELTRGLAAGVEHAGELGNLRARALVETGRDAEASALMVELARDAYASGRRDPGTLYQLAEFCAQKGRYDLAIRLLEKASAGGRLDAFTARIRQLKLDQRLEESYQRFDSRHFEIRFPQSTDRRYAIMIGALLEAERERLKKWIPVTGDHSVGVDLFPLEDFLQAYSQGVQVIGLFDGRLRLPFADLRGLHPYLGSVLTHELAHAMIAEITGDRAPNWFHEGLAQHVEPIQEVANPTYAWANVIAFPLVDAVLAGLSDPHFVDLSYNEALWSLHYLESAYGVEGIHRLLDAFARGRSTEQALRQVVGKSAVEFDRAFWTWCREEAPRSWTVEEPDYDEKVRAAVLAAVPEFAEVVSRTVGRTPKVGFNLAPEELEKKRLQQEIENLKQVMAAWHEYYINVVEPVKHFLGLTLEAMRGEGTMPLDAACRQLYANLLAINSNELLWSSPDPRANDALKQGYGHLKKLATACRHGSQAEFDRQLQQAEQALGVAAGHLQKYGLYP